MKIAVPSMGNSAKSEICDKLGRCSYIVTYDTESREYSATPNPGSHLPDGSGPKAAEVVINSGAETLLSMEVGMKAYSVLAKARINIQLLKSKGTVKAAVQKFIKNK
jgi:predicted Fe-Mo cluster-binding NifX family protein